MTHSFEALGTKWWITIFDEREQVTLGTVMHDIECFVATYEADYSRFKTDSLISILNRERTLAAPTKEYCALLTYGKQLFLRTNGRFNILTGHILEARGYNADYSFTDTDSAALSPGNPITDLGITEEAITLSHGNVDLGGYGKGYLIDLIVKRLQETHQLNYFLINGGGDMFATSNHGAAVTIYLEHPTAPGSYLQEISLQNQGFAASSPSKRRWKNGATEHTHIVGVEPSSKSATFIIAKNTCDADAFATTSLLLPTRELAELAKQEQLDLYHFLPDTQVMTALKEFTY